MTNVEASFDRQPGLAKKAAAQKIDDRDGFALDHEAKYR